MIEKVGKQQLCAYEEKTHDVKSECKDCCTIQRGIVTMLRESVRV